MLCVGDNVLVTTYPKRSPYRKLLSKLIHVVVEVYDQQRYPGGVRIYPPVDGIFCSWNEDSLLRAPKHRT